MYDLQSYLGKMSAGLISYRKLEQAKYGKPKKKKRNKVSSQANFHQQYYLKWEISEDDLP